MNMTSKRLYFTLLGLVGLLVIALPLSAYKVNGLLESHTQLKLKAKSQALDQEQQSFEVAQANIKKYASLEKIAKAIVPQDKSQAEATREIVNIASQNGVAIGSISFPPSTLGGAPSASSGPGVSSGSSSTATSGNANNPQNKLSQLTAVTGIPGVYQLPITVDSDSKNPILYSQLINFLSDLEHNRRTAQVDSISISPVGDGRYLTFTIILNEYIKP